VVVDGRERDLAAAVAGDRDRVDDDVHRAGLHRGQPLGRGQRLQLDRVRIAEQRAGDLVHEVDLEALDARRRRTQVAEEERVLIDAGDQATATPDARHEAAAPQRAGPRQRRGRAQARSGVGASHGRRGARRRRRRARHRRGQRRVRGPLRLV
jgi:hypothetical protein